MHHIDARMPGPLTEKEALEWVAEVLAAGRYLLDPHFLDRCEERSFSRRDWQNVVETATSCVAYRKWKPLHGGTSWRLVGITIDGDGAAIGFEAYQDHMGRRALLITIM